MNIFDDNIELDEGLIVAVGGLQSGKSTLLKPCKDKGFTKKSFADPVRDLAWVLIGYKPEDYEKFKRCVIGLDSFNVELSEIFLKAFPLLLTGRKILQYVGDGMRKLFGENFWVDQCITSAINLLKEKNYVYIDDCRYPNEIQECYNITKEYGGLIIFSNYNSGLQNPQDPHISELMAHLFLELGLKHGDVITQKEIDIMKLKYNEMTLKRN